jgi:hypothetical protein
LLELLPQRASKRRLLAKAFLRFDHSFIWMRRREMCSFHIPLYVAKYTTQAGVHCLAWGQVGA